MTRPRVLIVGAGFAGFHCAGNWSPLLPQVAAEVITP
jgi:NADH dehydrogenase FAD-containing subunit